MSRFKRTLVLALLITTIMSLIQKMKHDFIRNLSTMLFTNHNPDAYLAKLYSLPSYIFLSHRDRVFLSIDALLLKNDYEAVESIFNNIDNGFLPDVQKITLYEKKISYYLETHQSAKAIECYEQLKELAKEIKYPTMPLLLNECDILIHVYALKDGEYAEILEKRASVIKDKLLKGICLYRAGVSYYNIQDEENCRRLLKEAQHYLQDTVFSKIIYQILNIDLDLIHKKIM